MDEMFYEKLMGTFNSWKIDSRTWFITSMEGTLYMYLIEGDEKALLIDTCYGYGNLRAYIETLTDKPVLVVNTHGHIDHVGGNGWWDTAYMHKMAYIDNETLKDGQFDVNKLPHPDYKKVFVQEDYIFDLGNRSTKVIEIASHAISSIALYEEESGYLFVGDELESGQVLQFSHYDDEVPLKERIKKHLDSMKKLKSLPKITMICPAHNGSPIAKEYIDQFIELDELIINDQYEVDEKLNHPYIEQMPGSDRMRRTRHKNVSFIFKIGKK